MKLSTLIPETEKRFHALQGKVDVKAYFENAKTNHWYTSDYEVWCAMSLINALYKVNEVCDLYREYHCNNSHLVSLGKYFLRKYELI